MSMFRRRCAVLLVLPVVALLFLQVSAQEKPDKKPGPSSSSPGEPKVGSERRLVYLYVLRPGRVPTKELCQRILDHYSRAHEGKVRMLGGQQHTGPLPTKPDTFVIATCLLLCKEKKISFDDKKDQIAYAVYTVEGEKMGVCQIHVRDTSPPKGKLSPAEQELQTVFEKAKALRKEGRLAEAIKQYERALTLARDVLGSESNNSETLWLMHEVANRNMELGNLSRALLLYKRVLEVQRSRHGPDSLETAIVLNDLGLTCGCERRRGLRAVSLALDHLAGIHEQVRPASAPHRPGADALRTLHRLDELAGLVQRIGEAGPGSDVEE